MVLAALAQLILLNHLLSRRAQLIKNGLLKPFAFNATTLHSEHDGEFPTVGSLDFDLLQSSLRVEHFASYNKNK